MQPSAVQCKYVKLGKVYFCLNLELTTVRLSLPSLQLVNYLRGDWNYWPAWSLLGYFHFSKLHPCHLVLCKWIQYLRNILPIYPIAPLSAICGFSESKSHFWVWETILEYNGENWSTQCSVLDDSMKGTAVAENTFQFVYLTPRLHWRTCPIIFRANNTNNACVVLNLHLSTDKTNIILMFCDANLGRKWMIYF